MGWSYGWLAVRGVEKGDLLAWLDLEDTGRVVEYWRCARSFAVSPTGWLLVASSELDSFPSADVLAGTSKLGGEAIHCWLEERVMDSACTAYRDGAPAWSVTYNADKHFGEVRVSGEPPREFDAILAAAQAEQAADPDDDVDYIFGVPLELSRVTCGYREGQDPELEFTLLMRRPRPRTSQPGLLARLFKR